MMWLEAAFSSLLVLLAASLLLSSTQPDGNRLADYALQMRLEDGAFAHAQSGASASECAKYFESLAPACVVCEYSNPSDSSQDIIWKNSYCKDGGDLLAVNEHSARSSTSMDGKLRILTVRAYYSDGG